MNTIFSDSIITENVKISYHREGPIAVLSKLAITGTSKIKLFDGTEITPQKYDVYGSPIISWEIANKLNHLSEESKYQNIDTDYELVQVTYTERILTISQELLNNKEYISYKIQTLDSFNELVNERKMFHKVHPDCHLAEWIIFGKYYFDHFAQVLELSEKYKIQDIMLFSDFSAKTTSFSCLPIPKFPQSKDICPCCTKNFTIDDIKNVNYEVDNEEIYHANCMHEFQNQQNKYEMLQIIYFGYNSNRHNNFWTYTEIPNGYGCNCKKCQRRPWYIFHTCDGDIKIGWRKRVISIEFLKGFNYFPMSIFDSEEVTKWENGIHAWSKEKAQEYVNRVYKYLHKH